MNQCFEKELQTTRLFFFIRFYHRLDPPLSNKPSLISWLRFFRFVQLFSSSHVWPLPWVFVGWKLLLIFSIFDFYIIAEYNELYNISYILCTFCDCGVSFWVLSLLHRGPLLLPNFDIRVRYTVWFLLLKLIRERRMDIIACVQFVTTFPSSFGSPVEIYQ